MPATNLCRRIPEPVAIENDALPIYTAEERLPDGTIAAIRRLRIGIAIVPPLLFAVAAGLGWWQRGAAGADMEALSSGWYLAIAVNGALAALAAGGLSALCSAALGQIRLDHDAWERERRRREDAEARLASLTTPAEVPAPIERASGGVVRNLNNWLSTVSLFAQRRQQPSQRGAVSTRPWLAFSRPAWRPSRHDLNALIVEMAEPILCALGENVELDLRLRTDPLFCQLDADQFRAAMLAMAVCGRETASKGRLIVETAMTLAEAEPSIAGAAASGRHIRLAVTALGDAPASAGETEPAATGALAGIAAFVERAGGKLETDATPDAPLTMRLFLPAMD